MFEKKRLLDMAILFCSLQIEHQILQEQIERYNNRIKDHQDKSRVYRHQERVNVPEMDVNKRFNNF